jgi:hypothetical protein
VTPPAFARMSGITKIPFSSRIASAPAGRGAVGPLADHPRADLLRVLAGDHVLERGREQDVDVEGEQVVVRDGVAPRETLERPVACT